MTQGDAQQGDAEGCLVAGGRDERAGADAEEEPQRVGPPKDEQEAVEDG